MKAQWFLNLYVDCPKCDNCFDILTLDSCPDIIYNVRICESDKEIDVTCPECEHEFKCKTAC